MKTKNPLKKLAAASILFFLLIAPTLSKAQVPLPGEYPVTNDSPCSVNISIYGYSNFCAGIICSTTNMTIPANTSFLIPITYSAYDVEIVVNWVDNGGCLATMNPGPVSTWCATPNNTAAVTTGCLLCNALSITATNLGATIR